MILYHFMLTMLSGLPNRRPRYYGLFRHPERLRLRCLAPAESSGGCFWSQAKEEVTGRQRSGYQFGDNLRFEQRLFGYTYG